MAHFWLQDPTSSEWQAAMMLSPEEAHAVDLTPPSLAALFSRESREPVGSLHHVAGIWLLLASESVLVNGSPLFGGVRVLRDRDEVRVGSRRAYFSEEEPPQVVPFPGADEPILCPRCKLALTAGEPSVRCPCGVWYHQSAEFPCFTYSERCSLCDRATTLDAGFRWTPRNL